MSDCIHVVGQQFLDVLKSATDIWIRLIYHNLLRRVERLFVELVVTHLFYYFLLLLVTIRQRTE